MTTSDQNNTSRDFAKYRLDQNFGALAPTRTIPTKPSVGRPPKQAFFRVHPGPEWRGRFPVLKLEADQTYYLVLPELIGELDGDAKALQLRVCVTKDGRLILWPIADLEGHENTWNVSVHRAVHLAETQWVSLKSDMEQKCYRIKVAEGPQPEPDWPAKSFDALVMEAFDGRTIDSLDHPVVLQLRGRS